MADNAISYAVEPPVLTTEHPSNIEVEEPYAEILECALSAPELKASSELPVWPSTVAELIKWGKEHPISWYVPDTIVEGGVHVLHGSEASFKTMFTLQLHEALALGGEFLLRKVDGGLKTGIAQLEMSPKLFSNRVANFWPEDAPHIEVLPGNLRLQVLKQKTPEGRISVIAEWARSKELQFVSVDSLAKLFPPGCDVNRQDLASEIFSQAQNNLPTLFLLAHDRKLGHEAKGVQPIGNAEIVGSGRMAQDPDMVFQMVRQDKRLCNVDFSWGKVREGAAPEPLPLYFDMVDFRLYPINPLLHLLPRLQTELIAETKSRYGRQERTAKEYLAELKDLQLADGSPAVHEEPAGHTKMITLVGNPIWPTPKPEAGEG